MLNRLSLFLWMSVALLGLAPGTACLAAARPEAAGSKPLPAGADTAAAAVSDSARVAGVAAELAAADSVAALSNLADSTSLHRVAETLTATTQSAPPETVVAVPLISYPVFLGGKEIFRVRAARDGLSPKERAAAVRSRITTAVLDDRVPADSVRLVSSPQGVEVRLGRHFLWVITPDDVEGESPVALAGQIAELPLRVKEGINKERSGRRPLVVLKSVALALGLTLAAWLLLRLLLMASRRWHGWLSGSLHRYVRGVRIRNFELFSRSQITAILGGLLSRIDVVIGIVLLYFYLTLLFSLFTWTQGWSWQLLHFAQTKSVAAVRSIGSAIPGFMVIGVIVMVVRWVTQLSDRFFDGIEAGSIQFGSMHSELARPSKRILKIVLWIAAVIVAFPYIPGAQTKAFQGVSLFMGVLFSLGSTGIISNIIAGFVLTFSRAFRVGDRIKVGSEVGDVVSLGFFATKLRTIRNEEITLPNGQVASAAIVNYTRLSEDPGLILHTEVTIGYDVDWRTVHSMLIEAAGRVEGIEKDPVPWVFQRSLNDYHVSYELNCVTHLSHPQLRLYSGLHQEIQDVFARAGIEILSPGFHAIRDANTAILPAKPEGPRPPDGGFRIMQP